MQDIMNMINEYIFRMKLELAYIYRIMQAYHEMYKKEYTIFGLFTNLVLRWRYSFREL